ncbi:MAG TPA: hypothetical protein VLD67_14360, partial [Vicinamibacterales bacterium]|nr:hypothetical protein [Vicinamibacterales bacterium]
MNTVLVLTADDRLRARVARSLTAFSIFEARTDSDALRTLRLVDIDVILRETTGSAGALATFVGAAREIAPHTLVVAVGASGEDEDSADFTISDGFTARELEAVLRHALDRQRLVRELAVTRAAPAAVTAISANGEPWDGVAVARLLRGFSGVLAAGVDVPRALGMFLDSIGELVRPTRMALLR